MKPLAGKRVIEMGTVVLAPYAAVTLAELGADVIKVEPLAGDTTRALGHAQHAGMAALFLSCNRGKRSVVIDVAQPDGLAALLRLVASADVFLHNTRYDSAQKLGIDYASLAAVNPRLVYCATYGYGAAGRDSKRPAYDDIIQAGSGLAMLKGRVDGVPAYAPTILADKSTALFCVIGIMGALMEREATGRGKQIEVGMLETMVHFLSVEHLNGHVFDPPQADVGYTRLLTSYRRPHKTKDGYLAVMPHNEKQWRKFFTICGREDITVDPRFATKEARARNIEALYVEVSKILPTRTTAEWSALFTQWDVPFGPVRGLEEMVDDPHLNDVGYWHRAEHPTEGWLRVPGFPVRDGGPHGTNTPVVNAPLLGEHTGALLAEMGYTEAEITDLATRGIVKLGVAPAGA